MATDPYTVLGVPRGASDAAIRDAYRRLAKEYHPDLHPDDPLAAQKMNELNAAYEALRDPARRQQQQQQRPPQSEPRYKADPYANAHAHAYEHAHTRQRAYRAAENDPWEEAFRQAEQQRHREAPRAGLRFGRLCVILLLGYLMLSFLTGGCARLLGGGYPGRSFPIPYEQYETAPFFGDLTEE